MALLKCMSAPLQGRAPCTILSNFLGHKGTGAVRTAQRAFVTDNSEQPQVALVQGASRGLGLEYVRQLLSRPGQRYASKGCCLSNYCLTQLVTQHFCILICRVVATCRDPAKSQALQQLQHEHGTNLGIIGLDVTDEASIQVCYSGQQIISTSGC